MIVLKMAYMDTRIVLKSGPRGDDAELHGHSSMALTETLAEGKANHDDVLTVGEKAAKEFQVIESSKHRMYNELTVFLAIGLPDGTRHTP